MQEKWHIGYKPLIETGRHLYCLSWEFAYTHSSSSIKQFTLILVDGIFGLKLTIYVLRQNIGPIVLSLIT